MSGELVLINNNDKPEAEKIPHEQFLQVRVGGQLFGIPVVSVRDVLKPQKITRIPLSQPEVLGFMNLRGRIVTVIDMRERLSSDVTENAKKPMFVVVESDSELYCLKVDLVNETRTLPISGFENNPENMPVKWRELSRGVFKLDNELMLVLEINNLVKF